MLVRHAMPAVDPATDPATWGLGPEGRAAAAALDLPTDALLVASDEPKAIETLESHSSVRVDRGFGEVHRT